MLSKTGVALRARCCWLRAFGVSARCGMRKPNTKASVKPRPVQVIGRRFLVFDDVFTDGSTLREIARALLVAGAEQVGGLVLARQPWSS